MSKLKILIVDDEPDFAEFVGDVAENMGFDVTLTDEPAEFSSYRGHKLQAIGVKAIGVRAKLNFS